MKYVIKRKEKICKLKFIIIVNKKYESYERYKMTQYKLLGGGEIYNSKEKAIEQARFYARIVGFKPEIRKIENGVVQFESVEYTLY